MYELVSFIAGIGLGMTISVFYLDSQRRRRIKTIQSMLNHPSFSEVVGFSSDGKGNFYQNASSKNFFKSDWTE